MSEKSVGTYNYTLVSTSIPAIPLISVQLKSPSSSSKSIICQAILDTGSDCTLVPIPLVLKVKGKIVNSSINIPFGGRMTVGIPYEVGLILDRYDYSKFQVFAAPIEDLGELLIIGRDLMNQHRIEFNGKDLTFTIF